MSKQTISQGPNRFAIRKILSPGVNPYTALVERVGAADAMRLSSWISRSIETAAKSGAINNIFSNQTEFFTLSFVMLASTLKGLAGIYQKETKAITPKSVIFFGKSQTKS